MIKKLLLLIAFFISGFCVAQKIEGTVTDENGNKIFNSNILIKELKQPENIKEFVIARNGQFSKQLNKEYQQILIEVKSAGYFLLKDSILNPIKSKTYNFQFQLKKDTITKLEEAVIVGKRRPFKIKEDTVTYDVAAYSDGTERKIEEVIKKLPGIEVNEKSGEIKYKGKAVETVTLDGDNLFDYNYALGTKNINVDMVEQIEAIDNYSENPLLKGIEQGGKVSLNLKLKKGKTEFSGSLEGGLGLFNNGNLAAGLSANVLGVNKVLKSFGTFTYNNVGVNNSPFDYFGFNQNVEQLKEQNVFAKKVISENLISNILSDERANINDQLFGNYNALFRVNKRLSIKTNLYYIKDDIESNQFYQSNFTIEGDNFTTTDNTLINKKPKQYRADLELKYNSSKTSLIEYDFRIRQENIKTNTLIQQNNVLNLSSNLNSEDFYLRQNLLYTNKLSNKNALQVALYHSYNNVPQEFRISPNVIGANDGINRQNSEFKKQVLDAKTILLGSTKIGKYNVILGGNFTESPYQSTLINENELNSSIIENGENAFYYNKKSLFNSASYRIKFGRFLLSTSYTLSYLKQTLKDRLIFNENKANDLLFEPSLGLGYRLNKISILRLNSSYKQTPVSEQYFYANQVLISNRTTKLNDPSLEFNKRQSVGLYYGRNDLYNQFEFFTGLNFSKDKGQFFGNSTIDENTTRLEYFFLPQSNTSWSGNLKISKYVPFLESTFKLTSLYSWSEYQNIVNNSELRQNTSQFLSNEFFWKTAFDIPVNFENIFKWDYTVSESEEQNAFKNNSIQNSSKIIFKPSRKWFLILSSEYYLPNLDNKEEDFFFLDATLQHRPKSKRWDASLKLRNITNQENFEQVNTSDISTSIYRSNLLQRYFLLSFSWNF